MSECFFRCMNSFALIIAFLSTFEHIDTARSKNTFVKVGKVSFSSKSIIHSSILSIRVSFGLFFLAIKINYFIKLIFLHKQSAHFVCSILPSFIKMGDRGFARTIPQVKGNPHGTIYCAKIRHSRGRSEIRNHEERRRRESRLNGRLQNYRMERGKSDGIRV